MLTEDQILQILSGDSIQSKYQALEVLLVSKTSSRTIVEAVEKATHDDDMGVVARAIKVLQSPVHHRMAVEAGLFGKSDAGPSDESSAMPQEYAEVTQDNPPQATAPLLAGIEQQPVPVTFPTGIEAGPRLYPPPAGILRRGTALLIDLLILAAITTAMGLAFGSLLERIGVLARPISAVLALLYFGLLNSSIFDGATPGKRLMHLKVIGPGGKYIDIPASLLRSMVLVVVILFNGWVFPGSTTNYLMVLLVNLFSYGIPLGIFYLAVFNRASGQSLDDLLVGTWVVDEKGTQVETYQVTPRLHKITFLTAMLSVTLIIIFASQSALNRLTLQPSLQNLAKVYQVLNQDPRFYKTGVYELNQQAAGENQDKLLIINLWPRRYLDDASRQGIAQDAAELANTYVPEGAYDGIQVWVVGGYDLGFFDRSIIWLCSPPDECTSKLVRNSVLRFLNFTYNYQAIQ